MAADLPSDGSIDEDLVAAVLRSRGYTLTGDGPFASGAFSSISLAKRRGSDIAAKSRELAVKRVASKPPFADAEADEFTLTMACAHENVVAALDRLLVPGSQSELLVFEYCPGGDLFEKLENSGSTSSKEDCRRYLHGIASALAFVHSQGVVHCDVKLENVLLDGNDNVKLCDFGLAGRFGSERVGKPFGTSAYLSPELVCIRSRQTRYVLDTCYDVWSLGIVCYAVIFADLPWEKARLSDPDFKLFYAEGGAHEQMEPFHLLSRSMRDLMHGMLSIAPECRPSMAEVAEYFSRKEPWLASDEKKRRGRASSVPPRVEASVAVLDEARSRDDTAGRKSLADVKQVGVIYRAPAGVSGGSSTASSAASSRTASPLVVPLVAPISRRSPPATSTHVDAGLLAAKLRGVGL